MLYRILADIVVVIHFAFVLFVVLGGFLVLRWPKLAWVHVPAAIWGTLIEFGGVDLSADAAGEQVPAARWRGGV